MREVGSGSRVRMFNLKTRALASRWIIAHKSQICKFNLIPHMMISVAWKQKQKYTRFSGQLVFFRLGIL